MRGTDAVEIGRFSEEVGMDIGAMVKYMWPRQADYLSLRRLV